MRTVSFVLALAASSFAGPKGKDEEHPRSPGTPLEIRFTPWYCTQCVREGRIETQEKDLELWQTPLADLVKALDLDNWIFIETPHFRILSTLRTSTVTFKESAFALADLRRLRRIFPKLRIGRDKARLKPHQRAHLYHIRAERIYTHFAALTDNVEPYLGMGVPYELLLFGDYSDHHMFTDQFIGRGKDRAGVRAVSRAKPYLLLFTTAADQVARDDGKGDHVLSNHVIHNIVHNLVDGHGTYHRETWAWLEEGLAHYYTRRENPKYNSFCWAEGRRPADLAKDRWEEVVFDVVRRQKDLPLNQWCEKLLPGELTATEQGLSWSIVEWLVTTEPIRFTKMLRRLDDLEARPTCAQCIHDAFGVTPNVLHSRWRAYVLEHYRK